MWIVCIADNSHQMPSFIFFENKNKKKKQKKKKKEKHLKMCLSLVL